jgi:hypothetical protein
VNTQTARSRNRRRFIDPDGLFDLDLTYIFDRVIAMGIPFTDNSLHANDIREVARFLGTRHYGSFIVFNLCEDWEEQGHANYDHTLLYDQVLAPETLCKRLFLDIDVLPEF